MGGIICLELYPRSEVNIIVHVLETDGSILCTIFNAISMACMDAGILMTDMVVSCSSGLIKQQICQDLTYVEQANGAFIPIAIKARSQEVLHMQLDSRLTISNLESVMDSAINGCKKIKDIIELGIKNSMNESLISSSA
jgi:exosome complex component RRP41